MAEKKLDLEAMGTFNVRAFKESVEKVKKAWDEILRQDKKVEQIDLPIPKAIEFESNDNMSVDEVFDALNFMKSMPSSYKKGLSDANKGERKNFKIPVNIAMMCPLAFPPELAREVMNYQSFWRREYFKINSKYGINDLVEV